jgi:ABC-2 type transport system ATP-binding protein
MIALQGLVWSIGGRRLGGPLSVTWGPGTIVLRGPNGCGKTTLLRTIAGVIPAMAGRVSLGGCDLVHQAMAARRLLGWMPDRPPVPGTTRVGEWLDLISWAKGLKAGLTPLAQELGVGALLGKPLAECSLGEQRRAGLAAATLGDPPVLLLDEPDRGLDPDGLTRVVQHLRERAAEGRTNLVVTHHDGLAERLGGTHLLFADLVQVVGMPA